MSSLLMEPKNSKKKMANKKIQSVNPVALLTAKLIKGCFDTSQRPEM